MKADDIERAAYIAAHAIMAANLNAPELACPGARRTFAVDAIAELIKGIFAMDHSGSEPALVWRERPREISASTSWSAQERKVIRVRTDRAARIAH